MLNISKQMGEIDTSKDTLTYFFTFTRGFPYLSILFAAGLNSLQDRRHNL